MQSEAIAGRYAKALLDLAAEVGQVEGFQSQLKRFVEVFTKSDDLRIVLTNPSIELDARQRVLGAVLDKLAFDLTPEHKRLMHNFIRLLIDRGRIGVVEPILRAYNKLADERSGRLRGTVVSAYKLSDAQLKKLAQTMGKLLERDVVLSEKVDTELIGGLRVEVAGRTFDGSIRAQLQQLREQLHP